MTIHTILVYMNAVSELLFKLRLQRKKSSVKSRNNKCKVKKAKNAFRFFLILYKLKNAKANLFSLLILKSLTLDTKLYYVLQINRFIRRM